MNAFSVLLLIKFLLAFCSIVYELVLAQALSAFLENTVLRYSVTIGLYLFSMGFGAILAEEKFLKNKFLTLLKVEILLTVLGGGSLAVLHCLDAVNCPRLVFILAAHLLIIVIGVLTGLEVPIVMGMVQEERGEAENTVLAADYGGAFLGTLIFAFIFYPVLGLIPTAFLVAAFNAVVGLLLYTQEQKIPLELKKIFYAHLYVLLFLFLVSGVCLIYVPGINAFFLNMYLNHS